MEQKTVNFGEYNSKDDLGLLFMSFTKGSPTPQTKTIDIPFHDGSLDLTEYFGEIRYNDRTLSFTFNIPWEASDHAEVYSNVLDKIHGKRMKIQLSSEQEWYYEGRVEVGEEAIQNGFWSFPVNALCYPYKLRDVEKTFTVNNTASNPKEINIIGSRMPTIPSIEVNPANIILIDKNSHVYSYPEGEYDIWSDEGVPHITGLDNPFTLYGKGTLIIGGGSSPFATVHVDNFSSDPYSINIPYHEGEGTTVDITSHPDMDLMLRDGSYSFSTGTYKNTNFILKEGDNIISVVGQGTIKFIYKEGRL